jgi:glycosyltransferase involved in cell wall biosynthesis
MIAGRTVSLVMPCYNEEEGVRHVIESLPPGIDEIIAVDNNCTDRTAEVAQSLGAQVVVEHRRGYGAAYKTGFAAATQDVIVTMDADATYPTESIVPMVEELERGPWDFISGSRFPLANRDAMPVTNQLGNMILTMMSALFFFQPIRDSQSGMWVFRRSILPQLRLESDGMPLSEEIKIEAIRRGNLRFTEVHIPYHDRVGEAKLLRWRDGLQNLFYIIRLRFRR